MPHSTKSCTQLFYLDGHIYKHCCVYKVLLQGGDIQKELQRVYELGPMLRCHMCTCRISSPCGHKFESQLPANMPKKTMEGGPNAWVPAPL